MNWYLHACVVCGGDLYEDKEIGLLTCLMCGRSFPPTSIVLSQSKIEPPQGRAAPVLVLGPVGESAWAGVGASPGLRKRRADTGKLRQAGVAPVRTGPKRRAA